MPESVSDPSASAPDGLSSGPSTPPEPGAGAVDAGAGHGTAPAGASSAPDDRAEATAGPADDGEVPTPAADAIKVEKPNQGPPPSLTDAIGGPLGVAESAVPAALFVAVYTAFGQDTNLAAIVAVAVGVVLTVARLIQKQTVQFALSGLAGILLAAFVVSRTGKAEDFFLPGLLLNLAYASAYLISIVVRWPLIGVAIAAISSQGMGWRKDPQLMKVYTRASWIWVGLFVVRLAVQLPLYAAGALVALGVAKVAMGIPLFALGLWLTWLVVGKTALTHREDDGDEAATAG